MSTKLQSKSKTPLLEYDESFESDDSFDNNRKHDRSKSVSPDLKSRSGSRNSFNKDHEFKENFGSVRDVRSQVIERRPKSFDSYKYKSDSSEIRSISSSPNESFDRSRDSFNRRDFTNDRSLSNEREKPKSEVSRSIDKYKKRVSPDRSLQMKLDKETTFKKGFIPKDDLNIRDKSLSPKSWKESEKIIDEKNQYERKNIDDKESKWDKNRLDNRREFDSYKEKRLLFSDKENERNSWKKALSPGGSRSPSDRYDLKTLKETMFQEERLDKMKHLNRMNFNRKSLDNIEEESERRLNQKRIGENKIKNMNHYDISPRKNDSNLSLTKSNRLDFRETEKSSQSSRKRNDEFEKDFADDFLSRNERINSRESPKSLKGKNMQYDINKPTQSEYTKDSMNIRFKNDDDRPIRSSYASQMSNTKEPFKEPFSSLNDRMNLRLKI